MANIKSQVKRIETNRKAEARNKAVRSELKSAVKAVREANAKGDKKAAAEALKNASRKLDKAVSKGVLHFTRTRQLTVRVPSPRRPALSRRYFYL